MATTALLRRLILNEPSVHRSEHPTSVDFLRQFGRRVARRREELSMTQDVMIQELNRLSGGVLGRTSASVWENGHAPPDFVTIYYLAQVLKTKPEYLAYGVRANRVAPLPPRSVYIGEPIIPRSARINPPMRPLKRKVMVRRNWSA